MTIEAWVRSADDNGSIIYRQNNTQNFDPYFTIGIDDGCYHFSYRTDQNGLVELKQPDCTTDDTWHHIAAVIDDDSSFLYINGEKEVSMESPDGNLPEDFPMFFGVDGVFAPLTNYFKGNLDEVRIWNRALTRNEIHQNLWNELDVNSENGLVGYWDLNEFSGTGNNKIEDKTSNSADGTVYNAVQSNLSPVEIPRQIAIIPQDGKIIINWKDVSSNSISGYKIFRSTDMNASALLTTVGGNDTTYIDETVNNGTYYYYRIKSVQSISGNESSFSKEVSAVPRGRIFVSNDGSNSSGTGTENNPFLTIQYAIDNAISGDSIFVNPGTYIENINFNGKEFYMTSIGSSDETILQAVSTLDPVLTGENGESENLIIDGFKIQFGSHGVLLSNDSRPTVRNCIITFCNIPYQVASNSDILLSSNQFIFNNYNHVVLNSVNLTGNRTYTWSSNGIPLVLNQDLTIFHSSNVPKLIIEEGTVIAFDQAE